MQALAAAEQAETSKLGDLQSAVDDAMDAEQKTLQAYSEDLAICPDGGGGGNATETTAETAGRHARLLGQAFRLRAGLIGTLLRRR